MKTPNTYKFTLALKNVDESTDHIEDSLFEAGCDDALINFKNGAVYLEFERESDSLEEAVVSAIKNVQSSSVEADVAFVAPENLVTESEISKRLQVSRQIVSLWIKGQRRKAFPYPVMRLSEKSSLWKWDEVCLWLYENKMVKDASLLENALFFSNINAALEERDNKSKEMRHHLLERISLQA